MEVRCSVAHSCWFGDWGSAQLLWIPLRYWGVVGLSLATIYKGFGSTMKNDAMNRMMFLSFVWLLSLCVYNTDVCCPSQGETLFVLPDEIAILRLLISCGFTGFGNGSRKQHCLGVLSRFQIWFALDDLLEYFWGMFVIVPWARLLSLGPLPSLEDLEKHFVIFVWGCVLSVAFPAYWGRAASIMMLSASWSLALFTTAQCF